MNYEHLPPRLTPGLTLWAGAVAIDATYHNAHVQLYYEPDWVELNHVAITEPDQDEVIHRLFHLREAFQRLVRLQYPRRINPWPSDRVLDDYRRAQEERLF